MKNVYWNTCKCVLQYRQDVCWGDIAQYVSKKLLTKMEEKQMKISKILAGMSAAAIVASMAMIPASAAGTGNGKDASWW